MYTIQIKPWGNDKAAMHTSTLFEISSDKSFDKEKIIESKRVTMENNGSLCMYTTDITVPTGEEYYVRATREFKDIPSANHTIEPFLLIPSSIDNALFNNIVLNDPITIDTPFVYVNEEELKNPAKDYFTVTTSKFRCNQDGHIATHLIITNMEGEVLYAKLNERVDKQEFRIFKSKDIQEASVFVIRAIHVSTNMFESKQGKLVVQNLNFNFDIKGLTSEVPSYKDLTLYIVGNGMDSNFAREKLISRVYFRNSEDNPKTTRAVDITPPAGVSTITVPGGLLKPNSSFYLEIYCTDNKGVSTTRRVSITTERVLTTPSFTTANFKQLIEDYNEDEPNSKYNSIDAPQNFTSFQFKDGTYLLPSVGTSKELVKGYSVTRQSTVAGGISLIDLTNGIVRSDIKLTPNVNADGFYCRLFNEAILLVDTLNAQNKPEFRSYLYDGARNVLTQLQKFERQHENSCQGLNSSIIQYDRSTLWYVENVDDFVNRKIMAININDLRVTEVLSLKGTQDPSDPLSSNGKCGMFYNRKRGFIGVILPNGKIIVVDPVSKAIKEIVDSPIMSWSNNQENNIKTIELSNGDYLFINTNNTVMSNQVNQGNTDPIVYYDCELGKFTKITYDFQHSYSLRGNFCSNSPESYIMLTRQDSATKSKPLRVY